MNANTILWVSIMTLLLSSCAMTDFKRSGLSKHEYDNFPYWEQADAIIGEVLRFSDSWCDLAVWDRGQVVLQYSTDSDLEVSDEKFDRDTTVTRKLFIGGQYVYPTVHYIILRP